MFSGIIQQNVKILEIVKNKTFIISTLFLNVLNIKIGDSISINGICLTVVEIDCIKKIVKFELIPETLQKTNILLYKKNYYVNAELSLKINDYIGGHLVQGHIDGVGKIIDITFDKYSAWFVKIEASEDIIKFLCNKGFVTIDGMSITVINVYKNYFTLSFIPHTINNSIVKFYKTKSLVNLEVDCFSKHIYKYLQEYTNVQKNTRKNTKCN